MSVQNTGQMPRMLATGGVAGVTVIPQWSRVSIDLVVRIVPSVVLPLTYACLPRPFWRSTFAPIPPPDAVVSPIWDEPKKL